MAIDWLTVTVGQSGGPDGEALRLLMVNSKFAESGSPQRGFGASEQRDIMGGQVWRRWQPRQESKAYGKSYESWECSGPAAGNLADVIAGRSCKPTRVDIAFDVPVSTDYLADHFIEWVRPFVKARDVKIGISGEDDVNTRYIGGRQSERRIRVYRKDLESLAWAAIHGPTLRVELQLRDDSAVRWWQVLADQGKQSAWACAAELVASMTGYSPMAGGVNLPELATEAGMDDLEKYARFMKLHAAELVAFDQAGLPILKHAAKLVESSRNRMMASRIRRRVEGLSSVWALAETSELLLFEKCVDTLRVSE